MSKRDQQVTCFEVFSAQSCEKEDSFKLSGGHKDFDHTAKSYVWILDNNQARIFSSKQSQSLGFKQRYLVFQIFVHQESELLIDLGVRGNNNTKRRLTLSTANKRRGVNSNLAQLSLGFVRKALWINLCIDLVSLSGDCWKSEPHKSLDSITVCSHNSRIRRILILSLQPPDTTSDGEELGISCNEVSAEISAIPKQYQFGAEVFTQVINMAKIAAFEAKLLKSQSAEIPETRKNGKTLLLPEDKQSSTLKELATDRKTVSRSQKPTRNSELPIDSSNIPSNSNNDKSIEHRPPVASIHDKVHSADARSMNGYGQKNQAAIQRDRKLSEPSIGKDERNVTSAGSHQANYSSLESSGDKESILNLKPHPPSVPSTDRARRRPRIVSGGKEKDQNNTGSRECLSSSATSSASSSRQNSSTGLRLNSSEQGRRGLRKNDHKETGRKRRESNEKDTEESRDASDSESVGSDLEGTVRTTLRNTITNQPGNNTLKLTGLKYEDSENNRVYELKYMSYTTSNKTSDITEQIQITDIKNGSMSRLNQPSIVYTYASKPRSPKTYYSKQSSVAASFVMDPEEFKQSKMEKNYKVYKRGNRHPRTETKNAEESSGEEDHTPRRQRVRRTPRSKNNTPRDHGGPMPAPSALLPVKSIGQVTSIMGLSGDSTSRTLISSPTGQSFNRKSLREISRKEINELRASMGQKPYNDDDAEELERQYLKKKGESSDSSSDSHHHHRLLQDIAYSEPSDSDSADDKYSARHAAKATKSFVHHNYYDEEMKRFSEDVFALSDPRMCLRLASPPIVLPHEVSNTDGNSDNKHQAVTSVLPAQKRSESDNLYVIYDSVLKVYYDPKTQKYYELC